MNDVFHSIRRMLLMMTVILACSGNMLWDLSVLSADDALAGRNAVEATGWLFRDGDNPTVGTCWVVDRDKRLAVTCWHVAPMGSTVKIYFPRYSSNELLTRAGAYRDRVTPVTATTIKASKEQDLALLKLDRIPDSIGVLPLGDRPAAESKMTVIGHPVSDETGRLWQAREGTVESVGFIGNVSRMIDGSTFRTMFWGFNLSGSFDHGFSGSAVVNSEGQAVGCLVVKGDDGNTANCVGVGEIRRMLGLASGDPVVYSDRSKVVGCWGAYESEGGSVVGASGYGLLDDGTLFFMNNRGAMMGKYQESGNEISFSREGEVLLKGEITWSDDNTFRLRRSTQPNDLVFYRYRPRTPTTSTETSEHTQAVTAVEVPRGWHKVVSRKGGFEIYFPQKPETASEADGIIEYMGNRKSDNAGFGIASSTIPDQIKGKNVPPDNIFDAMSSAFATEFGLETVTGRDEPFDGNPGKRYEMTGDKDGKPIRAQVRCVLTDTHFYQAHVMCPADQDIAIDTESFFGSLSISD